jgi:hypothetical protein
MISTAHQQPSAMDGWLYGVLRNGPYRGHLVMGRQSCHRGRAGGSGNPVSVVSPSGEVILLVPGTDRDGGEGSLSKWLKEKGWLL